MWHIPVLYSFMALWLMRCTGVRRSSSPAQTGLQSSRQRFKATLTSVQQLWTKLRGRPSPVTASSPPRKQAAHGMAYRHADVPARRRTGTQLRWSPNLAWCGYEHALPSTYEHSTRLCVRNTESVIFSGEGPPGIRRVEWAWGRLSAECGEKAGATFPAKTDDGGQAARATDA